MRLTFVAVITAVFAAGCGANHSPSSSTDVTKPATTTAAQTSPSNATRQVRHPHRTHQSLIAYARGYLDRYPCKLADTPRQLARKIRKAMRQRGESRASAASGICNPTR